MSLTPAINFSLFGYLYKQDSLIAGVVDTAEKFIAGVIDTAEQFIASLLRLSQRIFEKSRNDRKGLLRGLGESDS